MKLPLDFAFNQNNLQDYLDCPRRFQLRHVLRQSWPALVSEPLLVHEALMEQGQRFHTLAQQYLAGVPPEALAPGATDLELQAWWDNFLAFSTLLPEGTRRTEFTLQTSLDGFRILAKYDLLIASPDGRLYIFDWKTSRQRTRRSALQERVQTRLYPYLTLKAAGHLLPEKTANAARIRMSYWFAAHPGQTETFEYTGGQAQEDEAFLRHWMHEISGLEQPVLALTGDPRRCRFCNYRSLCERGGQAGSVNELEDELEDSGSPDLDFSSLPEIEF